MRRGFRRSGYFVFVFRRSRLWQEERKSGAFSTMPAAMWPWNQHRCVRVSVAFTGSEIVDVDVDVDVDVRNKGINYRECKRQSINKYKCRGCLKGEL